MNIYRFLLIAWEVAKEAGIVQQEILAFRNVGSCRLKDVVLPDVRIVGVIHAVCDAIGQSTQLVGVFSFLTHFNSASIDFKSL